MANSSCPASERRGESGQRLARRRLPHPPRRPRTIRRRNLPPRARSLAQLGWRRNLLVNGMQTGRTQTIGVMIPPYDSFWVSVLSGIHDALAEYDYLPITVWIGSLGDMPHFEKDEGEGLRQINRLLDRRVDGLIMWPTFSVAYYHHFPEFVERRVPVAVIDHYSTVADSVETDEEQATSVVADHLLNLGHRRIACLSSRETPSQTWAIKRRSSFRRSSRPLPRCAK